MNRPIVDRSTKNKKNIERKNLSLSNGRKIEPVQQSLISADTIKKIVAVGLILLLVCGIFIPPFVGASPRHNGFSEECPEGSCLALPPPPHYLESYTNQLTFSAEPFSQDRIDTFPSYLSKVPFAGLMSGKQSDLCKIPPERMPTFEDCESTASGIHDIFKNGYPQLYKEAMREPEV